MNIHEEVINQLIEKSTEERRLKSLRYFKEDVYVFGVKSSDVYDIAKKYNQQIKLLTKHEFFELCEQIWQSNSVEESQIVSSWIFLIREKLMPDDLLVIESWIEKYINNWASCDSLCPKTVGYLLEKYPELLVRIKQWAKHESPWLRRAAAVSMIYPAKHGKYLIDQFEIAEILLLSSEDLVQKGYGWMLKVASEKNLEAVFDFVMKHKLLMPRTAFRYSLEKMPVEYRKIAMAK